MEEGVSVGGHLIQAVRFADGQAMIPSLEEGLRVIINKQNGRRINANKNKNKTGNSEDWQENKRRFNC